MLDRPRVPPLTRPANGPPMIHSGFVVGKRPGDEIPQDTRGRSPSAVRRIPGRELFDPHRISSMKLTVLIAGLAGACLLAGPTAQAQSQPGSCLLLNNGAPRIITGVGTGSSYNNAGLSARSNWSQQANMYGGLNSNWSWFKAVNRSEPCTSTKKGFSYVYTCRAIGQPCR